MRALRAVVLISLGLTLGLGLAELAFRARDDGAFPHVNFYEADDQLGTRLAPNASMHLRVATGNPLTTVTTNSLGFRGGEWPEPTAGEVLVVGDSQVFGLGVEADQTFSSQVSKSLNVPVLNAGVPTYGPGEYTALVQRHLRARKTIKTVVYVVNLSNDLFEADRPNLTRHRVWDGWAVRAETAPESVTNFPFRRQLFSQSHLVFAARKLWHANDATGDGVNTEGSWKDVATAGKDVAPPKPADAKAGALLEARAALDDQLDAVARELQGHLEGKLEEGKYVDELKPFVGKGDPRDILYERNAEAARRIDLTAYHLFVASIGSARNEKALEALAAKKKDPKLEALLTQRRQLRAQFDALVPEGEPAHAHPLEKSLRAAKEACDAAGATLVVVGLPLDVMISADEWKKYEGVTPIDLSGAHVLVEDLLARAGQLGAVTVDPTEALQASEPGAFLNGDLHLTPKGHLAVSDAIVKALRAPKKTSALELPAGRSWPPTEDEFARADECTVKGSTAAGCETKRVREWLRVACSRRKVGLTEDSYDTPESVELRSGGHGDGQVWQGEELVVLQLPVLEGDSARAQFWWRESKQLLSVDWPKGGTVTMALGALEAWKADKLPELPWSPGDGARQRLVVMAKARAERRDVKAALAEWNARKVSDAPICEADETVGGAWRRCAKKCDESHPCAAGHCEPWPGGAFCAVP